jgi:integrase
VQRSPSRKTRYPQIYERLSPRGEVTGYQVRPRFKGYEGPSAKTFERLTDARAWMEAQRAAARERKVTGTPLRALSEALDEYARRELPLLAATERRNRRRHLDWWRQKRGTDWLKDLTKASLTGDLETLDGVSYATRNRYKAALSAVLSAAVDWEWLDSNPLHGGSRRKRPNSEREQERDREILAEEWARLLEAAQGVQDSRLYGLLVVARASGAREGELMKMEWARLELRPVVVDRETGEKRPGVPRCLVTFNKNGDERMLFFPGQGGEILREMGTSRGMSPYVWDLPRAPLARCPGAGAPTPYGFAAGCEVCHAAFPDTKLREIPEHHPVPEFPTGAFRYAKKKAGIGNLRFHDLRHAWAAELVESGSSDSNTMILGGWRSPIMVRRYAKRAHQRGGMPEK